MGDDDNPLAAAPEATSSHQAAGAMLARAREAAALTVDAVASQLKLAPRQVRALESGNFAALPGRTFVRGFLRNYARLLDIDAESVLAALPAADDEPGLSHPRLATTHRVMGEIPAEHARRRSFPGWVIALALAAIVTIAVMYEMLRPQWPLYGPSDKPAASAPRNEGPSTPAAPAPPGDHALPNPVAPTVSDAAPSSGAASGERNAKRAAAPAAAHLTAVSTTVSTPDSSADTAPAIKASSLQIVFHGTSWLDVKDAKGASILTMTGNDGATRTLDAAPPLDLIVGNADHVDITFRGTAVDLAAHARQNVARLQLR